VTQKMAHFLQRNSKFVHYQTQEKIVITVSLTSKDSTTPQVCRYTTL